MVPLSSEKAVRVSKLSEKLRECAWVGGAHGGCVRECVAVAVRTGNREPSVAPISYSARVVTARVRPC